MSIAEYSSDQEGYSSEVEIYLVVNDHKLEVSRVCRTHAELRESADIPGAEEGQLVIVVDGEPHEYTVVLREPLRHDTTRVVFW